MSMLLNPYIGGALLPAAPQPLSYSNVKLLLNFQGSDGDTSTTDEATSPHAITFLDGAHLQAAGKIFGATSLALDGSSDYITAPTSTDWGFGTGPFCIEGVFKWNNSPSNCVLVCAWSGQWAFYIEAGGLKLRITGAAGQKDTLILGFVPVVGTVYHCVVARDGAGDCRIFVGGVMLNKTTGFGWDVATGSAKLAVGSLRTAFFTGYDMNGYVGCVRVTKGEAIYLTDSSFAPPTGLFPNH